MKVYHYCWLERRIAAADTAGGAEFAPPTCPWPCSTRLVMLEVRDDGTGVCSLGHLGRINFDAARITRLLAGEKNVGPIVLNPHVAVANYNHTLRGHYDVAPLSWDEPAAISTEPVLKICPYCGSGTEHASNDAHPSCKHCFIALHGAALFVSY